MDSKKRIVWLLLCWSGLQLLTEAKEEEELPIATSSQNSTGQYNETELLIGQFQKMLSEEGIPGSSKEEIPSLLAQYVKFSTMKLKQSPANGNSNPEGSVSYIKRKVGYATSNLVQNGTDSHPKPEAKNSSFARQGYSRDLLLVLPVSQGDADNAEDFKLENLYSKPAVTAMIHTEKSTEPPNIRKYSKISSKISSDIEKSFDLSTSKKVETPISISDYDYPDFSKEKFDFPKNHRLESTTVGILNQENVTAEHVQVNNNPFQLFESVKPIEINKILYSVDPDLELQNDRFESRKNGTTNFKNKHNQEISTQPAPATSEPSIPKYSVRNRKKPLKVKTEDTEPSSPGSNPPTAVFLPTPVLGTQSGNSSDSNHSPNGPVYHSPSKKSPLNRHKPTAASNRSPTELNKAEWNSNKTNDWNPLTETIKTTIRNKEPSTTPVSVPADILSPEMKRVLITLGILKPEIPERAPTATTEKPRPKLVTERYQDVASLKNLNPVIDPESYTSFKRIPTPSENKATERSISDDMKEFLASFGLYQNKNEVRSSRRLPRQQRISRRADENTGKDFLELRFNSNDETAELTQRDFNSENSKVQYIRAAADHVFRPTDHFQELKKENGTQNINDVIRTIKKLSNENDTDNLSALEVENRLVNISETLKQGGVNTAFLDDLISTVVSENSRSGSKSNHVQIIEINSSTPLSQRKDLDDLQNSLSFDDVLQKNDFKRQMSSEPTTRKDDSTEILTDFGDIFTDFGNETISVTSENSTSSSTASPDVIESSNDVVEPSSVASDSRTESDPTSSTTNPEPSTTTIGSNNAPIPELAASFGGGDTASEGPTVEDTTRRPYGLYFYVDWNTFLNVGESDKRMVNLQFSPKAGNARNFIPITFP